MHSAGYAVPLRVMLFALWRMRSQIASAIVGSPMAEFVPIEDDDRIAVEAHQDLALRRAVHEKLSELLVDDALGFDANVLTVEGDNHDRVDRIMKRIAPARHRRPRA